MRNALKAGFAYFSLVFATGFALGILRMLVIAPATGDLGAVVIELPIMLAVSWMACGWAMRRLAVSGRAIDRISMGTFAFLLLMVAEALVSILFADRNLANHIALYKTLPAIIGLFGQIAFALFPLLRRRNSERG